MRRADFTGRRLILTVAIVVGFLVRAILLHGDNDDFDAVDAILGILALVVIAGAVFTYLWDSRHEGTDKYGRYVVSDPPAARFLFDDVRSAPIWLIVRLYVGYEWINAGFHKITDDAWQDGSALQSSWAQIVEVPEQGRPAITYGRYRAFIQYMLEHE